MIQHIDKSDDSLIF